MTKDKPPVHMCALTQEEKAWKPTDEMIDRAIAALKNTPENLWEEFKAVEVNVGNLQGVIGDKLSSKLQELHPDFDLFKISTLLFCLRGIARKEAGIIDLKPST